MTRKFSLMIVTALMIAGSVLLGPVTKAQSGGLPCYCVLKDGSSAECKMGPNCGQYTNEDCQWVTNCNDMVAAFRQAKAGSATTPTTPPSSGGTAGGGVLQSKIIPECALQDVLKLDGPCGDITIFLELMFNIINYLFGIIGSVALLFFIYGGFVFILSEGNAERVAHGKSIIMSAVLGIIVAFSGYALVKFVGSVIGINQEYRLDAPAATRR